MGSSILAATALAAALSFACAAAAEAPWAESPWYVSADLGGYFRQPISYATNFRRSGDPSLKAPGTLARDYDPGLSGHLALGYRLSPRFRLEGELGETAYTGSTIYPYTNDPVFPALNGSPRAPSRAPSINRFSGAMNAFLDFRPLGQVTPYFGLGLGAFDAHSTTGYYPKPGSAFRILASSGVDGFGQAEVGVSLQLSHHWSVAPAYRFVRAFAANGDTAHIAKVGLRYAF